MSHILRRIFRWVNKYFMVPIYKLGIGSIFVNPVTGYIMVIKTIGRKTGRIHHAAVNYAIHEGKVYFISGWRRISDWYRNILAHPNIEVILPNGSIYGMVEEETNGLVRLTVIRKILKNAGFAGFFEGYNPFKISDEELTNKTLDIPVLRIAPCGVGNGAADPGGLAWIWPLVGTIVFLILIGFFLL